MKSYTCKIMPRRSRILSVIIEASEDNTSTSFTEQSWVPCDGMKTTSTPSS